MKRLFIEKEEINTTSEVTNHCGVVLVLDKFTVKGYVLRIEDREYKIIAYGKAERSDMNTSVGVGDQFKYGDMESLVRYINSDVNRLNKARRQGFRDTLKVGIFPNVEKFYMFDNQKELFEWLISEDM